MIYSFLQLIQHAQVTITRTSPGMNIVFNECHAENLEKHNFWIKNFTEQIMAPISLGQLSNSGNVRTSIQYRNEGHPLNLKRVCIKEDTSILTGIAAELIQLIFHYQNQKLPSHPNLQCLKGYIKVHVNSSCSHKLKNRQWKYQKPSIKISWKPPKKLTNTEKWRNSKLKSGNILTKKDQRWEFPKFWKTRFFQTRLPWMLITHILGIKSSYDFFNHPRSFEDIINIHISSSVKNWQKAKS